MRTSRRSRLVAIWIAAIGGFALASSLTDLRAAQARPPAGQTPAQPGAIPPPPQIGTGLILGQVVDAATGAPVPDATVTVTSRVPIASLMGSSTQGRGELRLLTGSDGRFVLRDLPKANILINASSFGYINGSSGQARPGGPSRPVEVDEAQRIADLRIKLWKYAVLTGTVADEAGEPAVGVSVRAFKRSITPGKQGLNPAGAARTDDRGVYRISDLSPGDYVVAVPQSISTTSTAMMDAMLQGMASAMPTGSPIAELAMSGAASGPGAVRVGPLLVTSSSGVMPAQPEGRFLAYQSLFYPATSSSAQATTITLKSGEERAGLDLQLKVISTVKVSGTVTSPRGPAANLRVRLLPADVDDTGGGAGFETATTSTIADGSFTFLGVPPGQYVARFVSQPGMGGMGGGGDLAAFAAGFAASSTFNQGAASLYGYAAITVANSDVNGVAVVLNEGARVSGRLEFDGSATRPTPQQLQTTSVSLISVGGASGVAPGQGRAGQDGTFKTPGYPPGRYTLNVGGAIGAWRLRTATVEGRNVLDDPIDLKDSDITDVVVTFTDKVTQIAGTVRTGADLSPSATIIAFPADYRAWFAQGMGARRLRTMVVPKTGAYTMANIPAGDYYLAALDDADVPENQDAAFYDALARVASRVTARDGERVAQDLQIVKVKR